MKRRRGLRITIIGVIALTAMAALVFNYLRPTSRAEAIRIATDYVKRRWPNAHLEKYTIKTALLGDDERWHVDFVQEHVVHCVILVEMNMNRTASLLDENRGVRWQWAEDMDPALLKRLRADALRWVR